MFFPAGPSKAMTYFIFDLLFPFNSTPGTKRLDPPTHSAPVASLLVGCCVPPLTGGHLRQRVRPSFFSITSSPHTTENLLPPHTFHPSRVSYPIRPLLSPPQLVNCCIFRSNGGHLRPMHTLHPPSLNFPITPFAAPNNERTSPPHVPTRPRFLTIFPSTANADFKLIVVCNVLNSGH